MADTRLTALSANTAPAAADLIYSVPSGGGADYKVTIQAAVATPPAVNQQTADYTLALTDGGKVVEVSHASGKTITIPPNGTIAFPIGTVIEVCRMGAGSVTIAQGSGVTIYPSNNQTVSAQYKSAFLRKQDTNTWIVNV